ncbi:DEAD-box ATP-dependent RNA helicase 21 [Tanacetum coccineum]
MKRSIDDVSNTMFHANKKPALRSDLTPREQRHYKTDRIREEENKDREPTPREQRLIRRDRVREEENKVREKDRRIDQKQAKKRERQEEVESVKIPRPMRSRVESKLSNELLKATHSTIQMAAIPLVLQHRDVIGVAETGSGKAAAFISPNHLIQTPPKLVLLMQTTYENFRCRLALKGRLIFGPDARSLYLTIGLITVPIVFLVFLVAASDPGIIPRTQPSSDVDDDWDATSLSSDWAQSGKYLAPTKSVNVNGTMLRYDPLYYYSISSLPDVAHVINYDMPGNIEHNSPVPLELARHEASKFKPGSIPDRPPRPNQKGVEDFTDCTKLSEHYHCWLFNSWAATVAIEEYNLQLTDSLICLLLLRYLGLVCESSANSGKLFQSMGSLNEVTCIRHAYNIHSYSSMVRQCPSAIQRIYLSPNQVFYSDAYNSKFSEIAPLTFLDHLRLAIQSSGLLRVAGPFSLPSSADLQLLLTEGQLY